MQNPLPLSVLTRRKITGRYNSGPRSLMILLADGWDVGEERRRQTAVWTKNQGWSVGSLTTHLVASWVTFSILYLQLPSCISYCLVLS